MNYQALNQQHWIQVITPENENYDNARSIYNRMIDKRPAEIAICKTQEDVIQAVIFVRQHKIEVSIKSGGHNGSGLAVVEMNKIEIDPTSQPAIFQQGCLLKDVDAATHEHGLALPSGITGTSGIGGLNLGIKQAASFTERNSSQ
jgi:FAD/FMN-containing dehydrogenase